MARTGTDRALRVGMSQRFTDLLVADHQRLHRLLAAAHAGEDLDHAAFAAFRAGLLRHIAIEEKVLFPAVRRARVGTPLARARDLRIEHAALTSLVVPTPDARLSAELEALLASHDAKEEGADGVYAECEAALTPADSRALVAVAEALPPVRVAPHFDGPGVYRTAALALAAAQRPRRRAPGAPSRRP